MTDNDIIKALDHEIFINQSEAGNFRAYCDGVPKWILIEALDLINRQKSEIEILTKKYEMAVAEREANVKGFAAEIERLKAERDKERDWCNHYAIMCAKIKAEAIKEFAERLKAIYNNDNRYNRPNAHTLIIKLFANIDDLVKEMVGDYGLSEKM